MAIIGKLILLIGLTALTYVWFQNPVSSLPEISTFTKGDEQILEEAFKNQRSNLQVEGQGIVTKLLADD